MADYSASIAKAAAKLREKGMPMVFVSREEGEYDPATNTIPTAETEYPFYGVKTSPTVDEVQSGQFSAGATVVLMGGDAFQGRVDTTDYLKFDGHKWDIESIKTVAPAEQIILYKLQVQDTGTVE